MAKEIFISYSRKDFEKVRVIKNELDTTLGIDCWFDLDGIESGDQFESKIITAINSHQVFLFMLSPNSMQSEWALDELDFAKRKNKRIVLIYIESCAMTDQFYFRYHKYDSIEWHNSLQHDKLIGNLRSWLNISTKTTSTEPNDAYTQPELGNNYFYGQGVPQDYAEAAKCYRKAAEQGNIYAQYNIAWCYTNGQGVPQDYAEAVKWYRKAAERGSADAQLGLGNRYYYGQGVPQDYVEAAKWYRKAAEQGQVDALYNLGWCYNGGYGVPQDYAEAAKWYRKAAEQGNKDAIEALKKIPN